jgi:hypothetical protein
MIDFVLIGNAIVMLLVLSSPMIIFGICFLRTRRKSPSEIGKKPIYQTTCSVIIDGPKYNFVRITLYDGFLVLMTILKSFVIPISAICSGKFEQGPPLIPWADELLIEPKDPNKYPYIIVDSNETEQFYRKIRPLIVGNNKG